MKLQHYNKKKLKKEILDIVGKNLDLSTLAVFFFGSRVNGKGNERSDIDIGIEGQKQISSEIMGKIKEEVSEIPTLYHIDVIDFNNVDKDFYKIAKENIEIINC